MVLSGMESDFNVSIFYRISTIVVFYGSGIRKVNVTIFNIPPTILIMGYSGYGCCDFSVYIIVPVTVSSNLIGKSVIRFVWWLIRTIASVRFAWWLVISSVGSPKILFGWLKNLLGVVKVPLIYFVFLANNRSSRKNKLEAHLRYGNYKFFAHPALRATHAYRTLKW